MYNYLAMADGNVLAEVSLLNLGVIGRFAAKTKLEVSALQPWSLIIAFRDSGIAM